MTHSLLPEDGATFHANIEPVEGDSRVLFKANYCVQLHVGFTEVELPDPEIFGTEEEAWAWLRQTAAARRFRTIIWEDQGQ